MTIKLQLLHVTHQYPPAIGGSEKYIADLSEELVKRGHHVDVFTSRSCDYNTWQSELPHFEERNGVKVYRFNSMQRRNYVWQILHFGLRNYWRTRSWRYEPFVFFGGGPISPSMFYAILKHGKKYDVIHLNCLVYGHVTYGQLAASWLNVPSVITPHAHITQEETFNIGYQQKTMRAADYVIADTEAERDVLLESGLNAWQVSVVGVGLKLDNFQPQSKNVSMLQARQQFNLPQNAFVILFLGRKAEYKGLNTVLEAYSTVKSQHSQAVMLAVGPDTDYSNQLMAQYNHVPDIHTFGKVSHTDKLAALQACDCLVLPSKGEAFGIVYLEAWLMEKAVIGSRVPAVASLINEGQDGLLIEYGNSYDLATCINYLIANPEQAHQMGKHGRRKVLQRYTMENTTDRLEGIYLRVLRHRQQGKH
ncbi:MAG: hypothetical protein B6242_00570 [Anaerolineaceae bacterium 4572_78]|nr:MAG: hypothetical protein B6242_00570 [Anaerolineaceae bacterium 4572_78]